MYIRDLLMIYSALVNVHCLIYFNELKKGGQRLIKYRVRLLPCLSFFFSFVFFNDVCGFHVYSYCDRKKQLRFLKRNGPVMLKLLSPS